MFIFSPEFIQLSDPLRAKVEALYNNPCDLELFTSKVSDEMLGMLGDRYCAFVSLNTLRQMELSNLHGDLFHRAPCVVNLGHNGSSYICFNVDALKCTNMKVAIEAACTTYDSLMLGDFDFCGQ